ncbi:hypothetical protein ES703_62164 [subsurface metagenome]
MSGGFITDIKKMTLNSKLDSNKYLKHLYHNPLRDFKAPLWASMFAFFQPFFDFNRFRYIPHLIPTYNLLSGGSIPSRGRFTPIFRDESPLLQKFYSGVPENY